MQWRQHRDREIELLLQFFCYQYYANVFILHGRQLWPLLVFWLGMRMSGWFSNVYFAPNDARTPLLLCCLSRYKTQI